MSRFERLTERERRLCREIVNFKPGQKPSLAEAGRRAGYSAKTASSSVTEALKKPKVKEYLAQLQRQRDHRTSVTAAKILDEMARIAFADIRRAFDENGNLKSPTAWDADFAAAVSNYSSGRVTNIKLHDKLSALEALAKRTKAFPDIPQSDSGEKGPVTVNFFNMSRGELERFIHNHLSETRSRNRAKPGGKG
jgi:phage terminase small subunit